MGAGKTTAARTLGLPAVDSDALVEAAAGKPIADIFRDDGEAAFRAREEQALVLALGGGAVPRTSARRRAAGHAVRRSLSPTRRSSTPMSRIRTSSL